jgi:glycolate oxidase iron-sulfur subunit
MPATASARAPEPTVQAADPLTALADRCVQCGLCLPHCPTYRLDRNESESPRGRIVLARAWAEGLLEPDPVGDAHLDHCLGCRRCEAVCPAFVHYGELLFETRRRQRERRGATWRQHAIEWLSARPVMLSRLLGVYRALYPLLPQSLPRPPRHEALPVDANAAGKPSVAIFRGCVARRYELAAHNALARLCGAAGFAATMPEGQTCCGALHAHAGNTSTAAELERRNRDAFAAGIPVLTTATGCHEAIVAALSEHAPVRDACAFLLEHAQALRFRPAQTRVALQVPCTQRAVAKSDRALRALLARIPQLELVELPDTGCCGAAGMHMLEDPERARALRSPLLDALAASGADVLLSANIGCRLHLANGTSVRVRHPLEFLAEHLVA